MNSRKYYTINLTIVAAALFWLSITWAAQDTHDWLIIPGERVGPITRTTSDTMLTEIFGAQNTEPAEVNLGEGFKAPGTVIYPSDAAKKLEVIWTDASRTIPKEIRLTGNSSDWRTEEGITLGTTLKELERLNGFPFRLAGFAFDYGGTITDCGLGRLIMLGCNEANSRIHERKLALRLTPNIELRGNNEYRQVVGDRVFSSGHPAMQKLNPMVYQLILHFN